MYHENVNVDLTVESVIQIKIGITINVSASVKTKNYCVWEKYYICYPVTCSCKNGKCLASIIDDSVITADEMIETTKIKFVWKNVTCRIKKLYFACLFINYYCIIDRCWYLLLPDKISSKTKTFITISDIASQITNQKKFYINKCIINLESYDKLK